MAVSTTTPTAEQVAVPETLLKKRRVNEKTREEKLAKAAEAQKVSLPYPIEVEQVSLLKKNVEWDDLRISQLFNNYLQNDASTRLALEPMTASPVLTDGGQCCP
jgi:hypothetical protein